MQGAPSLQNDPPDHFANSAPCGAPSGLKGFACCGKRPKALPLETASLLKKAPPKTLFLAQEKARSKPDFLYKRQSPVPTLAFGRRYGNNNENNSTWIHDRGITIKGIRTRCCPRTSMFADSFSAAEITPAPEGYHIAVRRARRSGEGCPQCNEGQHDSNGGEPAECRGRRALFQQIGGPVGRLQGVIQQAQSAGGFIGLPL